MHHDSESSVFAPFTSTKSTLKALEQAGFAVIFVEIE